MLKRKEISEFFEVPYETLFGWKNGISGLPRQKLYFFLELQDKEEVLKKIELIKRGNYKPKISAYKISKIFGLNRNLLSRWKKKRPILYNFLILASLNEINEKIELAKKLGFLKEDIK